MFDNAWKIGGGRSCEAWGHGKTNETRHMGLIID